MRALNARAILIAVVLLVLFAAAGQAAFGATDELTCIRLFCSRIHVSTCPVPDLGDMTFAEFCSSYWQNRFTKGNVR
jgi:hypothetical protein